MVCLVKRILVILCLCYISTQANAQRITQLSPPKINLWGVSVADYHHIMSVGDSATVLISGAGLGAEELLPAYFYHLQLPCSRNHTLYGVSYYDTLHATIVGDSGLIFTTSDAGQHWVTSGAGITTQTLRGITHTPVGGPSGSFIVVGDSGIILLSKNAGATWSKLASSTIQNINAIEINPSGAGFFVGEHGLIGKTTNFGISWPVVTDTIRNQGLNHDLINFRAIAYDYYDVDGVFLAVGDSGALAWSNGGLWTAIAPTNATLNSKQNANLAKANYRAIYFAGVTSSDEYFTIWGDGDFYLNVGFSLSTGDTQTAIDYENSSFVGDADGGTDTIVCRVTCATTWQEDTTRLIVYCFPSEGMDVNFESDIVEPDLPISFQNFLFLSIDSLGKGFATSPGGYYFKTTDNGLTWSWVFPLPDTMSISYRGTDIHTIDSNNAFAVGYSGGLFRTTDGGVHWNSTHIAAANQERLHSIAHPADRVYVVSGDFGTIIRSTDDALTWTADTVPTTNYLEAVAFSTPEIGIAAGQSGTIIRTTDQGVTWVNINNPLTGTNYSFRQLQAFPSGTYFATTDSAGLWRSTDQGQNWLQVPIISQTLGEGFYSDRIGVIGESTWSSQTVPDTMSFAFTHDGFATKTEFNVPFINNNRVAFHFIDSNTFICYGSAAFVVKVDVSHGGASVTQLSSPQTSPIQAFPNPNETHSITIEYDLNNSGATSIELWNTLGEKVQSFPADNETAGHHAQQLKINPALHGSFFVKVISEVETKMLPIVVE